MKQPEQIKSAQSQQGNNSIQFSLIYKPEWLETEPLKKLLNHICAEFSLCNAEISITAVDDNKIMEINKQFLSKDAVTDVISFDLSDENGPPAFEIIVNTQLAERTAEQQNHAPLAELALYICHGMLHNLGYDDLEASDAEKMHQVEDRLLNICGFGAVYCKEKSS